MNDSNTNTATIAAAQRAVDDALETLKMAKKMLVQSLARFDRREPFNSRIGFTLKHDASGKTYTYVAVKAGPRWYTSGSTCPPSGYSWSALVEFINEAYEVVYFTELVPAADAGPVPF